MWQRAGTLTSQCSMLGCHRTVTTMRFQCWRQCWQEGGGSLLTSIFGYYSSVDYLLLGHYLSFPQHDDSGLVTTMAVVASLSLVIVSSSSLPSLHVPWYGLATELWPIVLSATEPMIFSSACGNVVSGGGGLSATMILTLSLLPMLFFGVWFLFRILACYSLGCIAWYERNTSLLHLIFCVDLYACFITSAWLCSSAKLI